MDGEPSCGRSWLDTSIFVVVSRLSVFDFTCVIIRSVRGCGAAGVVALVVG